MALTNSPADNVTNYMGFLPEGTGDCCSDKQDDGSRDGVVERVEIYDYQNCPGLQKHTAIT